MRHSETVEVCIVGGGVAGAILASRLAERGIEVLVLEAGPRHDVANRYEYMNQLLNGIDPWVTNTPLLGYTDPLGGGLWGRLVTRFGGGRWLRVTGVGGSGLHWGANVDRLHESDFELRSRYGIGFDWPISYRDLEPYYTQVEKLIGVSGEDAHPWTAWRSEKFPMPPFPFSYSDKILKRAFDRLEIPLHASPVARNSVPYDSRSQCMSFSMCEACPILAKWTPDLLMGKAEASGKVVVKPNTRVISVNSNGTGKAVDSVTAATIVNGKALYTTYRAEVFVLAAHSFETMRLLLSSASPAHPNGLGNRTGHVGKFFGSHLSIVVTAELKEKTYLERIGFPTSQSHYFYDSSRAAGGTALVLYPRNRSINTPVDIVNSELRRTTIWGEELKQRVQKTFGFTAAIQALVEQLPHVENQVTIDKHVTDNVGLPIPRVTYSYRQSRESRAVEKSATIIRQLFEALDAKHIRHSEVGAVSSHQLGGCRMGDDPSRSVVDRDLKLHGIRNLYVAGASVFPTFGAPGPTLTIAALALRLGDHLNRTLRHAQI